MVEQYFVYGKGTDFRFFYCYRVGPPYSDKIKYTFLLHKNVVLLGDHDERRYNIFDDGTLVIWKQNPKNYSKIPEIIGLTYASDDPMVKMLNKALLEESLETMLVNNE